MGKIVDFLSILKKKKLYQQLWLDRIWHWADRFNIEEYNVPRNKDELLKLIHLSFESISYFKRDKFTELPKEFGNLTNLKFLELGSLTHPEILLNCLSELPKEIGNLTNLTHLYIQFNHLTELPKEIGNLSKLKDLKLGCNHLTGLPKEIGNLKQLEILTMWQNEITELPPEIGNLKQLKGFSIWGNPLVELPPEIVNLTELKKIELGKNLLLSECQKEWIKELKLRGCNVSYVGSDSDDLNWEQKTATDEDCPEKMVFRNLDEVKEYSIKNQDHIFTKNPDGHGYIIKKTNFTKHVSKKPKKSNSIKISYFEPFLSQETIDKIGHLLHCH